MFWSWYEWPDAVDYYWTKTISPVLRLPLVEFGTLSLLAPVGFWLLWRRKRLSAFAPVWLFAFGWMLSTVVFFLFSRYRLPVVPALLLLTGVVLAELNDAWKERRRGWQVAAALSMAAFVAPDLVRFAPRMDLVDYNLGRLADERGDAAAAEEHYRAAFARNPHDFLACLNLGNNAARRRDWPAALRFYQQAATLEPTSDDAESNLGGVHLALGDFAAAEQHLDRALTLNPRSLSALQNGALLRLREGDTAGARELVRRILEIDPQNPAALRLKERL
jgi:tetratricopeptide (TPR) repeat protein